jgi:hypothetical protein
VRKVFSPGVILGGVAVVLAVSGTAVADSLITSDKIKDGTVQSRDVKKGTLQRDRMSADVQASLAKADRSGAAVLGSPLSGSPGATGPKGDAGERGAAGAAGLAGAKGATGAKGEDGAPGVKGETGAAGAKGDTGAAGSAGAKGDKGDTGAAGAAGSAGAKGDTGAAGSAGAKGDTGATGADGAKGDKGDKGDAGAKGDPGEGMTIIADGGPALATTAEVRGDFNYVAEGTLIRDLTLQPGSYEIEAAMSVRGAEDGPSDGSVNSRVRCSLIDATTPGDGRRDTFFQDFFRPDTDSPGYREGLHIGTLVTIAQETKYELRCYTFRPNGGVGAGKVPSSKIVATKVREIVAGA